MTIDGMLIENGDLSRLSLLKLAASNNSNFMLRDKTLQFAGYLWLKDEDFFFRYSNTMNNK